MHMHTLTVRTARTDARCCSGIKAHLPHLSLACVQHCTSAATKAVPVYLDDFASTIKHCSTPVLHACSLSSRTTHRATHSSWFDKLARQTFDEVDVDNDGSLDHKELYIALLKL